MKVPLPPDLGPQQYEYWRKPQYFPSGGKVDVELKLMADIPERLQNGGIKKPAIYTYSASAKLTEFGKLLVYDRNVKRYISKS